MAKQKVIIIGAGLSGSLLAIYLAKRDIEADIYEARGDMRKVETAAGRSINLALSNRGIAALKEIGLDEYMLAEAVPMHGRMVHAVDGATRLLPYSGREGEYINSVSRSGLNIALINEAEKYGGVKFFFNEKCVDFDCKTGEAILENHETGEKKNVKGDTLIATDGAGSAVRQAMLHGGVSRFNFSQEYLEHGYKELHIPPGGRGDFLMEKNALHIWARRSFLMIALPNFDGSFTCTLFLAHEGRNPRVSKGVLGIETDTLPNGRVSALESFEQLKNEKSLLEFFQINFPDALPLMPTLVEDFFANPIGNLGTIKCFPWNVGGKALLLGDSAHAVVPFYGQGMNASFEDCRILNGLIEKHDTNWETVFTEYGALRKKNTDAIADMAEENFYEMRDAVANPVFVRKRELETRLEQTFPNYFSKYSMVTFREDLPYSVAMRKGNAQDKLLMEICANVENVSEIDLNEVMEKVKVI
ncbi:MAG: FAD-dependent oxidoreductase [Pyrinomonadaceae bacterium]